MKKRKIRKLHLHRETLRALLDEDLPSAAGGRTIDCTTTDTCAGTCGTTATDCTRCSLCCR